MELASDINQLDVNQLKNRYDLLVQKLEEETDRLQTIASNVKELRRQQLSLKFESSESDKLLKGIIESTENVQKSSLVTMNDSNLRIVQFNNNSKNVLTDYALFEREASKMQANNLQRFQDIPNIFGEESITNMTTEIDQKLNDISAVLEKEMIKFTGINDEYVQLKTDRKMMTKNMNDLSMSLKKLNFKYALETKLKKEEFK